MFEHQPNRSALRGMMLAACLALLAGCAGGGHASDKSADSALVPPSDLAASAGNAMVALSWTGSSGATGYNVKRATTSGGPYSQLAAPTATGYTDAAVSSGTAYYYVVSAIDASSESANSSQVTATPEAPAAAPVAPSALQATSGNAQVSLTWTASSGASSYDVKRSTTSGGPYTQLASSMSPSYTDSSVSNGTAYFYVVTAVNATGESPDSGQASATPDPAITTPAVPMGLAVTAGNAQASLTWSASSGASSYHLKRATSSGGPYTQVGAPTSAAYTDTHLSNGTTYYYVVSALDSAGESANSAQVSATPVAPASIPATPTNLMATAGNAQASLTWSASSGASSYHVKRATSSGGPYTQVGAPTSAAYTDTNLSNGTKYYYVVSALDSAGESANSAQVSATPVAPASIPATPVNLMATAGNAQASLTWSASSGASSYHLKRATSSGGPYTQVGAPTSAAYTDTNLSNGTTYYYVVSALDSAGESANSAQASATPVAPASIPATPVNLMATAGNAQASLTWSASSGASSYHLKRATSSGGPYTQVGAPTSAAYTDTNLSNGTTYYYVVSALNSAGESANSSEVNALPVASTSPPATGTWTSVTPASIDLTGNLSCGNFGTETVQADPMHPSNLYAEFNCQGIWKSTDYGATWTGPINTGTNGAMVTDCAGGIAIAPGSTANVPTIYESCIRGSGTGFWKSVDGGVNWTNYVVAPSGASRQDYYPPAIDPYDSNHLLMPGHEMDYLVESVDGGQTWTNVTLAGGMLENGGTGQSFFINTGSASTTRGTWLWMAQQSGGTYGTWRTTNHGATWTQVDKNEHPHGLSQIYQPDGNGVVYMAGAYSDLGWGVLRSADYGQTWTHQGPGQNEAVVIGTSKNVYSMFGWPEGVGYTENPSFELAAQPGNGTWSAATTPGGMTQGPGQMATVNDGTHNILVGAMYNAGLWRYVEP